MSDTVVLAMIAAAAPTLAAIGAIIIGVYNIRLSQRVAEKAAEKAVETGKKADVLIEKTAEIHTVTNSNLSAVTKALEIANQKILGLEQLLVQMVEEKRETKSVKTATDLQAAASTVPPPSAEASLKRIDEQTAAIERNTAPEPPGGTRP